MSSPPTNEWESLDKILELSLKGHEDVASRLAIKPNFPTIYTCVANVGMKRTWAQLKLKEMRMLSDYLTWSAMITTPAQIVEVL